MRNEVNVSPPFKLSEFRCTGRSCCGGARKDGRERRENGKTGRIEDNGRRQEERKA